MEKLALCMLAVFAVGHSLLVEDFYPFDRENDNLVPRGDSESSPQQQLSVPIVFYDKKYDSVTVHTDGFITLENSGEDTDGEVLLAPFMSDLDTGLSGEIYFKEHKDNDTTARANADVRAAFIETASDFNAGSVFVATWDKVQSASREDGATFTFQCVVATDGISTFSIFLYPQDGLAVGENTVKGVRNEVSARAGFNDGGREQLEILSADELLGGDNAGSQGQWIFQIGGTMFSNGEYNAGKEPERQDGKKTRQSGFKVSEVNFNEDFNIDYESDCDTRCSDFGTCREVGAGFCCMCDEGYFGNGQVCIRNDVAVRYNGEVTGYSVVLNSDNSWSNETASKVDLHAYVVTSEGRAFSAMNGNLSPALARSLQPMTIFGTTLGWLFAKTTEPAINGVQYSGGTVTSTTYIRYTTGAFEFRVQQKYDQVVDDETGDGKVLNGRMTFQGRLPAVGEDDFVKIDDYSQVYTKIGPGKIRTHDTRSYTVHTPLRNITHSYTILQTITFEGCEEAAAEVPEELILEVRNTYAEYVAREANLRFAMNNHVMSAGGVRPAESEVPIVPQEPVRPVDPSPGGVRPVEPSKPTFPESMTVCERELQEAERMRDLGKEIADEIFFPTCTDLGTFAPRQCTTYDSVCWCVDQDTGVEIDGTRTLPQEGYRLDCSDVRPPPPSQTSCEEDRSIAENARDRAGDEANSIFMPRCMESGAYEPVQQLPDGTFMCVDFDGEEISRSREEPQCLTPCQLEAYVAESSNIFKDTSLFVVQCKPDGEYLPRQCVASYCFCVDRNGLEVPNSRVETRIAGIGVDLDCQDFSEPVIPEVIVPAEPDRQPEEAPRQPIPETGKLLFAQSMGINIANLPITHETTSQRLYGGYDQTPVAITYDCTTKTYYWSDVVKRAIYSAELEGDGSRSVVISSKMRSPEGVAVDFISGNLYWTDSEYDRIEVSKTDGSNRMTLIGDGLRNPRGIAVDPFRGHLYWSDWYRKAPKIMMADMDGSNVQVLASEGLQLPNDITVDFYNQKVCFIDAGTKKVECMNLDGSGRRTIYVLPGTPKPHPFGLAIDGDVLFYSTWRGTKEVHAVNWRTGDNVAISGPRGTHGQTYGVAVVHSQCPRGYNHCGHENGGCSHLCLPTPYGRVCKCPPGAVGCTSK